MKKEQIKKQQQVRIKTFDDVFHCVIIALERLEGYLSVGKKASEIPVTAIKTDRDLHDDIKNPPTEKLLYSELEVQCMTLFYQTRFDDEELFHKTVSYFLKDLLMWYGGRPKTMEYDDIDKFFIPIVSALDRQVEEAKQIGHTVIKYVKDIGNTIEDLEEDAKEQAVREGFTTWLLAQDITQNRMNDFLVSGKNVEFTVHKRGSIKEGLERLYRAFTILYEDSTPVYFLETLRKKYLQEEDFSPIEIFLDVIDSLKKQIHETGQERN
ncbi:MULTISPECIES: hypothetical protein [unclassified Chryseobacterium]|uniref:hypothetical protein n=1 Tax=unclassified Chryseobacterium TaxID=2593645 RepID=UPI000D341B1C|nr:MULTISPECIES: hypothetical protein [unclassified Chryseobacterium]PTT76552.1 hypothetical protein DBR25_05565 [Chryseobacterium sp. HMWF001]PVV55563.1 hypothetical protein DD829_13920 [Chryseobacterium sp. HMWF035]